MKITRYNRATLENPYAIDYFEIDKAIYGICASGSDGDCVMFPMEGKGTNTQRWSEPNGGAQTFKQLDSDSFLAIQGFFPEFHCESARLILAKRQGKNEWTIHKCFDMPFLHKFTLHRIGNSVFILAATLSGPKSYKEDWSISGQVLIACVPDDLIKGPWNFKPLIPVMTKNHGFWEGTFHNEHVFLFSACEGLFCVIPPQSPEKEWIVTQLLQHEISDVSVFDLDGDGKDELITINNFHGNELAVYHESESGYEKVFRYDIDYGHTVWAGELYGIPSIIVGELFGHARLILLTKQSGSTFAFTPTLLGSNIGSFGVKVRKNTSGGYDVLCSARQAGQAIVFKIEQ